MAADIPRPAREHAQRALEPAHVEVRLRARRDRHRRVRADLPDRVDLRERGQQGEHAEDEEEERAGLDREVRVHGLADDVALGAALARHLGVLLVHHQEQVRADQRQQQAGDQQHVDDVEPDHELGAGELPAEQEERQVRADHRDTHQHALGDPHAGAGQQVVRHRVAEEALEDAEGEQAQPDQPVGLARLAVGPGEEDPQQVAEDRGQEQVRRPVVDLPHEQAAAHVEADPQRGRVRLAHPDAVQLRVRPVVDDLGHARVEEQRQEDAGQDQDDERVERDLAEQERPVVGEDLAQQRPEALGGVEPVVEFGALLRQWLRYGQSRVVSAHPRSQKLGPTGSWKSLWATR